MSGIHYRFTSNRRWCKKNRLVRPSQDTTCGQQSAFSSGALVVASGPANNSPFYLSALLRSGTSAGLSDSELLERFASRRGEGDELAELAFATLVARHGPMVLRVCRAGLADQHEAEDAFQATFLVLAMRAGSIRRRQSVGSWLHGVALRVASCARSRGTKAEA